MEMYKFIRQLGRGKFGDVWLVKGLYSKKQYVLKQIDLRRASKREQRAAYLEVKLLATLKHPNIVSYLDSFHDSNGSLYIIMGYCETGDLYNFIRERNGLYFEEKQIVSWFVQICMALKYLHDRNILHRDLKTQNIFLTKSKLIKVGDLGIARVLNGANDMATTLIGTPYYMSPEIFNNKPYNHKSDVWALGCCVYEMATLKQAFNAQDLHTLVQKVVSGKVSVILNHYSIEFINIVTSMLDPEPDQRPSVTEILLNTYVRKHILMFLEETKHSIEARSKQCNNNSELNDCKLWEKAYNNEDSAVKQNSENHLPSIDSPESVQCSRISQCVSGSKNHSVGNGTIVTPDINGNGDGNDNSQQRSMSMQDYVPRGKGTATCRRVGESCRLTNSRTVPKPVNEYAATRKVTALKAGRACSKENLNPSMVRNCFSQPIRHPMNHQASAASRFRMEVQKQLPKKPHTYVATARELQNSGEMSLNFLSNLTYTIRQARNAVVSCSQYSNGPQQPPCTSSSTTPRSLCISVQSLPNMKGECLLCCSHPEDSSSDTNVGLLKQIMNCNQKVNSNPAARQRRRQKLEKEQKFPGTLTKSAPASMEMFPDI